MKKAIIRVFILLCTVFTYAQQGINYTALVKDGNGSVIASQLITVQFQILEGTDFSLVYQETHTPTTDANGIIIINIGEGETDIGVFEDIDWEIDTHFLNTQIDIGAGLIDIGTTGFKTVSYVLQAKTATTATIADNGIPPGGTEGQVLTIVGGTPTWAGGTPQPIPPAAVVGDFRDGGVVFWVDPLDNTHGLVCAIEDQPNADMGWANNRVWLATGATGTAIGTGMANTDAILDVQGTPNGIADYSAWVARAYNGGGFNDWSLPSQDELNEMWLNKTAINATAIANGGDPLIDWMPPNSDGVEKDNFYWTSTENSSTRAYIQSMFDGQVHYNGKGNLAYYVRAIRAF